MTWRSDLLPPCPPSKPCLNSGSPSNPGSEAPSLCSYFFKKYHRGWSLLLSLDPVQGADLKGIATFFQKQTCVETQGPGNHSAAGCYSHFPGQEERKLPTAYPTAPKLRCLLCSTCLITIVSQAGSPVGAGPELDLGAAGLLDRSAFRNCPGSLLNHSRRCLTAPGETFVSPLHLSPQSDRE